MIKLATRLSITAAAASMAVLPIAAQANTRAGDSTVVYTASASQLGVDRDEERKSSKRRFAIILGLLAAFLIGAGVSIAQDVNVDGQSPGT